MQHKKSVHDTQGLCFMLPELIGMLTMSSSFIELPNDDERLPLVMSISAIMDVDGSCAAEYVPKFAQMLAKN